MNGTEQNCTVTFETDDFEKVGIVRAVVSAISIITLSVTLFFVVILKKWKTFNQTLVIYLLVSALLASIGAFIDIDYSHSKSSFDNGFCKFSGYFTETASLMFLNAIFAITFYLFFFIVRDHDTGTYWILYFVCIFVIPLLVTWIPFVKDAYGKSGVWCWIRAIDYDTCQTFRFGQYVQYILYFIPIYLLLSVGSLMYLIMFIDISKKQSRWANGPDMQQKLKRMKQELLSLVAYPAIFALLHIPSVVNRIYSTIKPQEPHLAFWYSSGIFGPLAGIFTVVAYTLGTKMWQDLSRFNIRAAFWSRNPVEEYPFGSSTASNSAPSTATHYTTMVYESYKT